MRIKPAYLNLNELTEDCLSSLELYLNGIDLEYLSIDGIIKTTNIIIDVYSSTYSTKPASERDPLEYRVHTTALSLISEAFHILESSMGAEEIMNKKDYAATVAALNKLKKATSKLLGMNTDKLDIAPEDLSMENLEIMGIEI